MSRKATMNFVFFVVLTTVLAGCSVNQESMNTGQDRSDTPWAKNGNTYTFEAAYDNSAGTSEDTFTVILDERAVVLSAEAVPKVKGGKHEEGLTRFNTALAPVIVGKNLSDLGEFDTLGQYSLTTDAFNDALKLLQDQVGSNS